jgi:twitching motility protein PilJ
MNSIRKQVQETAKRIKKLGERSQEISQIAGLIDDLSDRTSLLALNASLQASAAGEAGKGFAMEQRAGYAWPGADLAGSACIPP